MHFLCFLLTISWAIKPSATLFVVAMLSRHTLDEDGRSENEIVKRFWGSSGTSLSMAVIHLLEGKMV
uniref:Putative secreted protein n=1 Tax=Anopheles marajoara TaxID=58244 RepID=A0A2M4CFJ5_9DIPT